MSNLPAHLQNRQSRNLAGKASEGIGGALPPHISIRGNRFTLVDAAGNKKEIETTYLDAVFVDLNEHTCKMYYENDWEPDSNEPPTCFSMNGVAPSRDALTPQAATCEACPQNVRGSATSKLSGVAIKACRDEKVLAVLPAPYPTMPFQIRVLPGSFRNWGAYTKKLVAMGADLHWLVTRISFEAGKNGVLTFAEQAFLDAGTIDKIDQQAKGGAFDLLVGRNDVPRQGALPAPAGQAAVGYTHAPADAGISVQGQPVAFTGGFGQPPAQPAAASPAAGGEPQRRKRRTKAEMEADARAAALPATDGFGGAPEPSPARQEAGQGEPMAPFRPAPPAAGGFGISPGVEPNADLQKALAQTFGQ